jgi:hypothetical protein
MVTAVRVAGNNEGEGSKAMETATRVAGERMAVVMKRVMAMKTREAGEDDGHWQGQQEQW